MHRQKGRIQEAIIVGRKEDYVLACRISQTADPGRSGIVWKHGNTGVHIFYMLLEWLGARFRASSDFEMLNNLKPSNDRDSTSEMPNVV